MDGPRRGMLVAKLTYQWNTSGGLQLDDQDPFPIFTADVSTPLGLLPSDDVPRAVTAFEVMLLGCAHAKLGSTEVTVSLTVGGTTRSILVIGDRDLRKEGAVSPAKPFREMPLIWERAFGGTASVLIDVASPVLVSHPDNPYGRGFDVGALMDNLRREVECPPGYPQWEPQRKLQNLESPSETSPVVPLCWAPLPKPHNRDRPHRACPDWILQAPPAPRSVLALTNLTDEGRTELQFPDHTLLFEYVVGDREGTRRLAPAAMVLLPEERRLYVVHRLPFTIDNPDESSRRGVLRLSRSSS